MFCNIYLKLIVSANIHAGKFIAIIFTDTKKVKQIRQEDIHKGLWDILGWVGGGSSSY